MRGLELAYCLEHGLVVLRLVGAGWNVEALSQQRDLLVLRAEFEHGSFGDDDHVWAYGSSTLPPRSSISFCRSASNCDWSGWKLLR